MGTDRKTNESSWVLLEKLELNLKLEQGKHEKTKQWFKIAFTKTQFDLDMDASNIKIIMP